LLTIIGLGNELLSDDGVGIRVVRMLKERLAVDDVSFEELSVGGLALLDHITGCEWCILVDAIITGSHPPGTAYRFIQTSDHEPATLTSSHQIDLAQVLKLAAFLRADLPRKVIVYAIEAGDIQTFSEACTSEVSRAIPELVDVMCRDVQSETYLSSARTGEWQILYEPVPDCFSREHI
jgi:hydrogenase maturation protease